MISYREARDHADYEYGAVAYLNGEGDAVETEGYVSGAVMRDNGESVVVVVEPEQTVQIPFDRVVTVVYPTED